MSTTQTSAQDMPTSSYYLDNEHIVLGKPATDFYAIHYTALAVLAWSAVSSIGVLITLLACFGTKFRERLIGERLVVYLAVCDLIFSLSHCMDHGYMVATETYPPDALCRVFAIIIMTLILTQSIIVTFTAANCFYMVVMEKRFKLGPHDCRLIVPAFCVPLVVSVGAAIPGLLGTGPSWCLINTSHKYGGVASAVMGVTLLILMMTNILFYGLVWGRLRKANRATTKKGKYDVLAKTLTVFVAVYILQYMPSVVTNLWSLRQPPPTACVVLTVVFTNLGGVFNFVAYTLFRRRSSRAAPAMASSTSPAT